MDFTTNDEIGILIEGYELRPMILENWHPPYYRELIEAQGFGKAMDLLMWELAVRRASRRASSSTPRSTPPRRRPCARKGSTIRNMRKRNMADEMRRFTEVYNEAWGDNWGFVPLTDAEVEFQAKNLKQVIDENWAFIAEKDGEVVGAALTLPDINQVLAKMNGRLLPLRLAAASCSASARSTACASSRSASSTTTATPASPPASTSSTSRRPTARTAIAGGEMGWILETNEPMNRAMEGMGGTVVKRYRIYEKALLSLKVATCGLLRTGLRTRADASLESRRVSEKFDVEGEVLAEEDVERRAPSSRSAPSSPTASRRLAGPAHRGAHRGDRRRRRRRSPGPRRSPRSRAVGAVGSRGALAARLSRRKDERPTNVVASRSFLVDVHLLGR